MMMQQSRLERENLEAHVDLCGERYRVLEEKLDELNKKMEKLATHLEATNQKAAENKAAGTKVVIGAAATVIAGLLSTIILLLMNLQTVSPMIGQ